MSDRTTLSRRETNFVLDAHISRHFAGGRSDLDMSHKNLTAKFNAKPTPIRHELYDTVISVSLLPVLLFPDPRKRTEHDTGYLSPGSDRYGQ